MLPLWQVFLSHVRDGHAHPSAHAGVYPYPSRCCAHLISWHHSQRSGKRECLLFSANQPVLSVLPSHRRSQRSKKHSPTALLSCHTPPSLFLCPKTPPMRTLSPADGCRSSEELPRIRKKAGGKRRLPEQIWPVFSSMSPLEKWLVCIGGDSRFRVLC